MTTILAARGDSVGDYGALGGIVGLVAIVIFMYIIADGPTRRGK